MTTRAQRNLGSFSCAALQAKAPISNDENVLNQALLEQSQNRASIRESQSCLATLQRVSRIRADTVAQIRERYSTGSNASDRFESGHRNKEAELAALRTAAANSPVQLSQATTKAAARDNGNEAAASAFSPLQAWS